MVSIPDGSGRKAVDRAARPGAHHRRARPPSARAVPEHPSRSSSTSSPSSTSRASSASRSIPNYRENGKFYIAYSAPLRGDAILDKKLWWSHTNTVSEMTVSKDNPNKANANSEKIISQIDWPQFNHNGHWIGFGPDGKLYVSTGDGGYANDWGIGHNVTTGNGQDLMSLHGKMLRFDVDKEDRHPDRQSLRRAQRRPAADLGARAAQPVALLLRHGRRPGPLLRRRPAELLRGDQPRHARAGTTAGARWKPTSASTSSTRTRIPPPATRPGSPTRSSSTRTARRSRRDAWASRSRAATSTAARTRPGPASTSSATGPSASRRWTARSSSARRAPTANGRWRRRPSRACSTLPTCWRSPRTIAARSTR